MSRLLSYLRGIKHEDDLTPKCTHPAAHDFPQVQFFGDPFATVIVIVLIIIYLFVFLARICDRYLVTAIKIICYKLHFSSDVAGATLMAAAVSSPDLFINLVGTFLTEGDVGIGTVVGCGVFNSLALPALCIFLIPAKVIKVDFYPLVRDCLFCFVSIILLTAFLYDSRIQWFEALTLVILYGVYLVIMAFNGIVRTKVEDYLDRFRRRHDISLEYWPLLTKSHSSVSYGIEEDLLAMDQIQNAEDVLRPWNRSTLPIWLLTLPLDFILAMTIPKPRGGGTESKIYYLTFIMSVTWIGILCYLILWAMSIIGYILNIPDSALGLTFIAIGMSIPEAASSIIVAKQGHGSMALSNSMGANNFDVLICLGLPWLLKATYNSSEPGHYLIVKSQSLALSVLVLLSAVLIMFSSLCANKFRLDKTIGWICSILYILFFVISCLLELNIFFPGNLPNCP